MQARIFRTSATPVCRPMLPEGDPVRFAVPLHFSAMLAALLVIALAPSQEPHDAHLLLRCHEAFAEGCHIPEINASQHS